MSTTPRAPDEGADTARLEAFSDGVFAVAITLLVLDLHAPTVRAAQAAGGLLHALADQWPNYLSYGLSFLTILIYWVNHHNVFKCIRHVDRAFLLLNGLLLMSITLLPFATAILAAHLQAADRKTAEVVYSGLFLISALIFNSQWRYARHDNRLMGKDVSTTFIDGITRQFSFGPPLYSIAFVVAFFSAEVSLAICILLAAFFALPSSLDRLATPKA